MAYEVTLIEMLNAREARVNHQNELLAQFQRPVISFSMNIAGPVKDTPLIRRAFHTGCADLDAAFCAARFPVLRKETLLAVTGCEAMYCVDADPVEIKRITTAIEDASNLGRLFDMDVIAPGIGKLDRDLVNGGPRCCIVCGAPGKGCASRRVHSVPELQAATERIMTDHFRKADAERACALAVQALLDEVCTTPKPGLVDRANNGSHDDMDIFTFTASAAALTPYWHECFTLGQDTASESAETVFAQLRLLGQKAERRMFTATHGINTHKGAIFTLGTVLCAAGRLWQPKCPAPDAQDITAECSCLCRTAMEQDFRKITATAQTTTGQKLFAANGLTGVRGELASGLPHVTRIALPAYLRFRRNGLDRNAAGARTLLHLIADMSDTNMISRGGYERAAEAAAAAAALLSENPLPGDEDIQALDALFSAEHLSPGGCADLLSVTYFLADWTAIKSEE